MNSLKSCDYCHNNVSIFEGLTEFGKWFHESCYVHKSQKEIESYKKKWINGTLTDGDKVDLVDKWNLVEKLKTEKTVYCGETPLFLNPHKSKDATVKTMLVLNKACVPILDDGGHPILFDEKITPKKFEYVSTRPNVERIKTGYKPRLLSVNDIPLLMEKI